MRNGAVGSSVTWDGDSNMYWMRTLRDDGEDLHSGLV